MEVLTRPDPETVDEVVDDSDINEEIEEGPVTKLEIKNAIKDMKNGKAAGIDNITVEMMKADIDTTINVLHDLLNLIWEDERIIITEVLNRLIRKKQLRLWMIVTSTKK